MEGYSPPIHFLYDAFMCKHAEIVLFILIFFFFVSFFFLSFEDSEKNGLFFLSTFKT